MEARIIEKQAFHVVGMTLETLLKDEREQRNIPKLFQTFEDRIEEVKNRSSDHSIGIFIDPPNYNHETDKFRWIAGVEVLNSNDIPDGMELFTFSANTYASTTYKGTKDATYRAYDFLYKWVNESEGYELADTYGIEQYLGSDEPGTQYMDLMFPVRKIKG
ncbi:GyrI-like domain-containing protein [Paenibacillus solani]|uniref:GyrI-like domain-containing protein n=1 Tax=Paenibacillus solani TaxID=1705565 RepID=UPI003D2D2CCC